MNNMKLVGSEGCEICAAYKAKHPNLEYIEMPDIQIGLGDTIAAITSFFGITPCRACQLRRHWCNKWFPYKRKIDPKLVELKQILIKLGAKEYPVLLNENMDALVPLSHLDEIR